MYLRDKYRYLKIFLKINNNINIVPLINIPFKIILIIFYDNGKILRD